MCKPTYERQAFFTRGHEKGWPQDRIQRAWDAFTAKRDIEALSSSTQEGLRKSAAITEEILAENEARRPGVNMASIRPGDEVTVRFVAGAVVQRAGGERLTVHMATDGVRLAVRPEDIVSHTPRRIEIGDRVAFIGIHGERNLKGNVIAVHGDRAWVSWDSVFCHDVVGIDAIERA